VTVKFVKEFISLGCSRNDDFGAACPIFVRIVCSCKARLNHEATLSNAIQVERRCCFDTVAVFGNSVERNFVLSATLKQTEHVQFVSVLSR